MGNIGIERREVEFEPLPEAAPPEREVEPASPAPSPTPQPAGAPG
jgi:hypothetical protein